MKTTIEISDALLIEARKVAEREGTTLRALVERGLRETLKRKRRAGAFRLEMVTFGADGLHPQAGEGSWERLREITYEGRGE